MDATRPTAADAGTSSSSDSDDGGSYLAAFEDVRGGRPGEADRSTLRGSDTATVTSGPGATRRPRTAATGNGTAAPPFPLQRTPNRRTPGNHSIIGGSRLPTPHAWPLLLPLPPSRGSHQTWVTAFPWNKKLRRQGYRTSVLLDSGAGDGNFCSVNFFRAVECTEYGSNRIVSKRG